METEYNSFQWQAHIHGVDVYRFFEMLMLDLPWEYGKAVGRSVLTFETYNFLPSLSRIDIHWLSRKNMDYQYTSQQPKLRSPIIIYEKESSDDLLVLILRVSSYISGGIHVMIERRFQVATMFLANVETYEYGEVVKLPWSKQDAAAVRYGRDLIHWFLTWLEESWATKAQSNMLSTTIRIARRIASREK